MQPPGDDADARSAALLTQGGLPTQASARLTDLRVRGAFTSDLSVEEFRSVRSVGFHPVGQVLGTCVYQLAWTGTAYCGSGGGMWGSSGLVAPPQPATPLVAALYDARRRALTRMQGEASALGGDGVVAVRLSFAPFPEVPYAVEFKALGTAVRADGAVHPARPFLSHLSGQQFAQLIGAGWVPTGLAMGIAAFVRHDDYRTRMQSASWSNAEITGYTELVTIVRHDARAALAADLRQWGGDGVVVSGLGLQLFEQPCRWGGQEGRDHVAEASVLGTAIARFTTAAAPHPPLAVLPVSGTTGRTRP
ncbi:MAG TPA: heavy metal-binding domain-containing protein [Mycobacteriales bacterium]|nr:heavy metal-binding domain-containing protein [Mycobacteriales bacterium]